MLPLAMHPAIVVRTCRFKCQHTLTLLNSLVSDSARTPVHVVNDAQKRLHAFISRATCVLLIYCVLVYGYVPSLCARAWMTQLQPLADVVLDC